MRKMKTKSPDFRDEGEERGFWAIHSPLDYFDSKKFKRVSFPNLKPSLKSVSIRLPEDLLNELKTLANKKDVPYQSLAKIFLAKQIVVERESLSRASGRRKDGRTFALTSERIRSSPLDVPSIKASVSTEELVEIVRKEGGRTRAWKR